MAVLCGSRDFGHFFIILVPSLQIASFFYSEHMLLSLYFPPSLEWAWSTAAIQLIWGSWAGLDRGESFCPLPFGSFPLFHSQALQTHPQLQFSKTEWPCLIRGFSHHIISRSLDPSLQFSRSVVSDSLQPHESQHARPPLFITNSPSLLKLMSIESVMPSSHLILCRPLLLLTPIPPSIRVFSNESTLRVRWPKYWSFSLSISPSNEHPGLLSFRMDWLDLLAVQGTLKSLLQHHSSKASILQRSAFFIVQLSHPYTTTGKTITLTRWTFVGKVMSLLFMSTLTHIWPPLTHLHITLGKMCGAEGGNTGELGEGVELTGQKKGA